MQLTVHFSLEEFTDSDTASKQNIDNTPNIEDTINMVHTALFLETVRAKLNVPISISSGFRCLALNTAVGGVSNSAHLSGRAADIHVQNMAPTDLTDFIAQNCPGFDQVIDEHSGDAAWTHVGVAEIGVSPRGEVLKMRIVNGKKVYSYE